WRGPPGPNARCAVSNIAVSLTSQVCFDLVCRIGELAGLIGSYLLAGLGLAFVDKCAQGIAGRSRVRNADCRKRILQLGYEAVLGSIRQVETFDQRNEILYLIRG